MSTATERAWAAGVFEGEGSIAPVCGKNKNHWTLSVNMTDRDVVARFHRVIGSGKLYGPYKYYDSATRKRSHHKKFWRWSVSDRDGLLHAARQIENWLGKRRGLKLKRAIRHVERLVPRPNMIKLSVVRRRNK